eukprot:2578267-Pleurochrysis_carterae.AAC.3
MHNTEAKCLSPDKLPRAASLVQPGAVASWPLSSAASSRCVLLDYRLDSGAHRARLLRPFTTLVIFLDPRELVLYRPGLLLERNAQSATHYALYVTI